MSSDRVFRTRTIDGVVLPAVIHNGGYYFTDLPVFADGLVDCWELLDLQLFRQKLEQGWVVPAIPDGESISVHSLGSWRVEAGHWELDEEGLYQRVLSVVRSLNPKMEN